jgi:hypothetical protein
MGSPDGAPPGPYHARQQEAAGPADAAGTPSGSSLGCSCCDTDFLASRASSVTATSSNASSLADGALGSCYGGVAGGSTPGTPRSAASDDGARDATAAAAVAPSGAAAAAAEGLAAGPGGSILSASSAEFVMFSYKIVECPLGGAEHDWWAPGGSGDHAGGMGVLATRRRCRRGSGGGGKGAPPCP